MFSETPDDPDLTYDFSPIINLLNKPSGGDRYKGVVQSHSDARCW